MDQSPLCASQSSLVSNSTVYSFRRCLSLRRCFESESSECDSWQQCAYRPGITGNSVKRHRMCAASAQLYRVGVCVTQEVVPYPRSARSFIWNFFVLVTSWFQRQDCRLLCARDCWDLVPSEAFGTTRWCSAGGALQSLQRGHDLWPLGSHELKRFKGFRGLAVKPHQLVPRPCPLCLHRRLDELHHWTLSSRRFANRTCFLPDGVALRPKYALPGRRFLAKLKSVMRRRAQCPRRATVAAQFYCAAVRA